MWLYLKNKKYAILSASLILFILTPLMEILGILPSGLVILLVFTLLILAGINSSEVNTQRKWLWIFGGLCWITILFEYLFSAYSNGGLFRIITTLIFFSYLFKINVGNVLRAGKICFEMIVAVMAGFVILGILGGICYELLDFIRPNSLIFLGSSGSYSYYYFSFINLTSVGFGDIIPQTSQAQSIAIILGLLGQFYLAFGVTIFVGKFLEQR